MAMKDWKQGTQYWNKDTWYHYDKKYGWDSGDGLIITEVKRHTDKNYVWQVFVEVKGNLHSKYFKTKSQALSYARSYMRSH